MLMNGAQRVRAALDLCSTLCTLARNGSGVATRHAYTMMLRKQPAGAGIAVLIAGMAVLAIADGVPDAERTISCTNPASGATWQIRIDYIKGTVDSNPAQISDAKISWHDAKDGGNYTLDRKSGRLTVIVASSTGGYFLYDQCGLEKLGGLLKN